jgi:hypothetical protein
LKRQGVVLWARTGGQLVAKKDETIGLAFYAAELIDKSLGRIDVPGHSDTTVSRGQLL